MTDRWAAILTRHDLCLYRVNIYIYTHALFEHSGLMKTSVETFT